MNQLANENEQKQADQNGPEAAPTRQRSVAYRAVEAMLTLGEADPKRVVSLLRQYPGAKAEVYELLHRTIGNGFVSQVEVLLAEGTGVVGQAPGAAQTKENLAGLEDSRTADEVKQPRYGTALSRKSAAEALDEAKDEKVAPAATTPAPEKAQDTAAADAPKVTESQTKVASSAEIAKPKYDVSNFETNISAAEHAKLDADVAANEAGQAAGAAATGKAVDKMNASNFTIAPPADGDKVVADGLKAMGEDAPKGGAVGAMNASNFTIAPPKDGDEVVRNGLAAMEGGNEGAAAAGKAPAGGSLKDQQRAVTQFDSTGDFYDQRATVEAKPTEAAPKAAEKAPEAAPKAEDKSAIEKGAEEKPDDKANGTVKITASALRVRAAPSLKGQILGKLPRGETVQTIGREGPWLKIKYGDVTAYIHSKYTASVKGNESGESEEEQGEGESQEQKQERPKPTAANANEQKNELV